MLSSLAYHGYEGVALRDEEKPRLQADLGRCTFLMLRNHGLLTVGKTVADAFLAMYTFENTCRIQVDALAGGQELVTVDPQLLQGMGPGLQNRHRWPGLGPGLACPAAQAGAYGPWVQDLSSSPNS